MAHDKTVPDGIPRLPVRSLRVEVLEGVDAGKQKVTEADTLTVGTAQGNDLVLTDPTVSRFHAEFARRGDGVAVTDNGSTNGIVSGNVKIEKAVAQPGSVFRLGRTTLRVVDGDPVAVELFADEHLGGLRGKTPSMRRLMVKIERAAKSSAAALLVGESGTGKEVVARALHDLGPRAQKPFVTVDCGSLSPTLVASELFGHEKGAFTGADRQHVGAFERAHGGTLFLDEIGELPAALQTNLLGALERRKFRRLGGKTELAVDLRVIGATNRDLRSEVNRGTFRLDLYYRLAVVVLALPPLRERTDDIPILVEHFLHECGHDGPVEDLISAATMKSLLAHFWPGNVRELKNLIEATVAMGETPPLEASGEGHAASSIVPPGNPSSPSFAMGAAPAVGAGGDPMANLLEMPYGTARSALLKDFEGRYLRRLVERAEGNVSRAAREAKMDRSHLIDLLRRHDIR